ncbi:MAG: site-2 protease family protein [Candidatus Eisenbacteria bacterium]
MFSNPAEFLLLLPPLLFALTVHEWSHGYAAMRLGDPTARLLGRLTLNPLAHLDPLGSIIFLLPPHIGWAKPVPVDERYLNHPRRDMMWIALAGPVSNVILALLFGTLLRVAAAVPMEFSGAAANAVIRMIGWSVVLNLSLAAFNMIPIFPLDGSRVLTGLLPAAHAERYRAFDAYGPMLLLGVVLLGSIGGVSVIGMIISPFVRTIGSLLTGGIL